MSKPLPNNKKWNKGDIVIYYADPPEPRFLRVVKGFTDQGLVKTQYTSKTQPRTVEVHDMKYLVGPRSVDLNPQWGKDSQEQQNTYQANYDRVRHWNFLYQAGTDVRLVDPDHDANDLIGVTCTPAMFDRETGEAYVGVLRQGNWDLKFVFVEKEWITTKADPPLPDAPPPEYDVDLALPVADGPNTVFRYRYRDGDNYKIHGQAVFAGRITPTEMSMIVGAIDSRCWFIPQQVGMEPLQKELGDYDAESDHVWHEVGQITFTTEEPTDVRTISELAKQFYRIEQWDDTIDIS